MDGGEGDFGCVEAVGVFLLDGGEGILGGGGGDFAGLAMVGNYMISYHRAANIGKLMNIYHRYPRSEKTKNKKIFCVPKSSHLVPPSVYSWAVLPISGLICHDQGLFNELYKF